MPRTENQKVVTGYLALELYDKLEQFKLEEGLKSDSKAITTILERWFFGETPIPAITKTNRLEERLSEVERICENLVERVVRLTSTNTVLSTANNIVPSTVLSTADSIVPDTVPSTADSIVPDTVVSDVPSTADSIVPDTVVSDVPSTADSIVPDTVPDTVPSTTDDIVPDAVPGDVPSTIASDVLNIVPSTEEISSNLLSESSSNLPSESLEITSEPTKLVVCKLYKNNPNDPQFWRYWAGAKAGFVEDLSKAKTYTEKGSSKVINQLLEDDLHKPTSRERISCRALEELTALVGKTEITSESPSNLTHQPLEVINA